MNITNVSVRKLDFHGVKDSRERRSFNKEQCIQLSRSPLGMQCETLLIKVKNPRNILDLVNNMPNLQSLYVQCDDDSDFVLPTDEDVVFDWLRQQLPSTISMTRRNYITGDIRIWIR
jgi:hypothetical protein